MSKDWRRGGGILVNVNLANHKGQFAYDNLDFQIDAADKSSSSLMAPESCSLSSARELFERRESPSYPTQNITWDRTWIHERSRNPLQKRNPALTAFCYWINKFDSGIFKNSICFHCSGFFKILKRF